MQDLLPPINTQDGLFHDGNPASGELGTIVPAQWLNASQSATRSLLAELKSVLDAGGLTPDSAKNTQVLEAVKKLAWGGDGTQRPSTLSGYGITDGLTGGEIALPLSALPCPTISSSDNRLALSAAIAAGQGGTVSIPAGVSISLGQEATAGLARMRNFTTSAWTSPVLAAGSEYYLRAQVVAGLLTFYVQRGSLLDTPPASLKGTINAASGGGFTSTPLDICVARIITGSAGSTPILQRIINRPTLSWTVTLNSTGVLYLPFDPHTRTARLTAANPTPHPTLISQISHGSAGWQGANYAYIGPNSTPFISPSIAWGGTGAIIIHSNNVVGDMTISTSSAQFDHINAKSLWQVFQTEHQQGDVSTTNTSDELLLAMGVKTVQQIDYDNGLAINYQNCVNAQFSWEIIR
jgi:hypothetical protein